METWQPLRIGEVLAIAFRLYRSSWGALMGSAAVIAVPLYLATAAALAAICTRGDEITGTVFGSNGTIPTSQVDARFAATGIIALVGLVITGFVAAASAQAITDLRAGEPASVASSLGAIGRSLAPLVVVEVLYVVGIACGIVAFIVPGVWLYVAWSLAVPALIVEGGSPLRALARSRGLVRGRWWPVAGTLITAGVIVGIAAELLSALLGGLTLGSDPSVTAALVVRILTGIVAAILLQPFTATVITVLLYELRGLREGDGLGDLTAELRTG